MAESLIKMSQNLKHSDFIAQFSENAMIESDYAQIIIDEILVHITALLQKHNRIELRNFGIFSLREQQKRSSLDSPTYTTTQVVCFKPSKSKSL